MTDRALLLTPDGVPPGWCVSVNADGVPVLERPPNTRTLRAYLQPRVRVSDLANRAGVSRQYVHAVLAGTRQPSAKLLAAAVELGIPVEADA